MAENDHKLSREQLLQEIAELRTSNQRLRALNRSASARFNAFMEHSPMMAFIKDSDGRLLYANPRFLKVFNFTDTDWHGKTDRELWPEDTARRQRKSDIELLRAGRPVKIEESVPRSGGMLHWLSFKFPFSDIDGSQYIGGAAIEITEMKNLQQELRTAKEQAESSTRAKSEFLANISHEIRTPMHGIMGAAAILNDQTLKGEAREYAGIIHRSAHSLLSILNDVLDYANIEAGKLHTELAPLDLDEVIGDIHNLLRQDAQQKQLRFEIDTSGLITRQVIGDFSRIRQILVNLVSNAIKFTSSGHVKLVCASHAVPPQDVGITIAVQDTGIGIPTERIEEIFEYFAQVDSSTTRAFGGTGMGLAISRRLAQLMGGDITCHSQEGEGSTFTLQLQLTQYRNEDTLELPQPTFPERAYRKTALLVEDNRINLLIATRLLHKLGLTIETAENGREAVSKVQEQHYDLVIMDLQMPVMDGLEATRRIRQLEVGRLVPIVALTANAMAGTSDRCFAAGMNGYLTKPIALEPLIAELDRWLV